MCVSVCVQAQLTVCISQSGVDDLLYDGEQLQSISS